ncbi:LysE family translocator [Aliikangiella sp. IMCC44632]
MLESFIALITATALLLGSPGPAPLSLAATGATFGVKRGIPFLSGILVGLSVAIGAAIVGIAGLLSHFPSLSLFLKFAGAAYILYIAFKIACAPLSKNQIATKAPNFQDGFVLNLLNPKAYAAFFAIFSQFLLPFSDPKIATLVTGLTCLSIAAIVDGVWLALGGVLKPIFSEPMHARVISIIFALSMVVAVAYTLI